MIRSCVCYNEFQDKTYGRGNRVMNECKKGAALRCASCLREYSYSGKSVPEKKGKKK
jgi:hypothetical protein